MKCPQCSRLFATKAALKQHREAAHQLPPVNPPAPSTTSGKKKKKNKKKSSVPSIIQTPKSGAVFSQNSDSATITGTDRIFHAEDVFGLKDHALVVDLLLTPASFERLKKVASAFQHVTYNSVTIVVASQVNFITSGGYVASFVRDPADQFSPQDPLLLSRMTSMKGSVTQKWSESASMPLGNLGKYFTSQGLEIREFSPGRLLLAVDGKATQSGSLTVFAHWSVSLSGASLEGSKIEHKVYTSANLWNRSGHSGLFGKNSKSEWVDDIGQLIDGVQVGDKFKLPFCVTTEVSTSYNRFWGLVAKDAKNLLPSEDMDTPWDTVFEHSNLFLPAGTILEKLNVDPGEALGAFLSDQTKTREPKLAKTSNPLNRACSSSEEELDEPMDYSRRSSSSWKNDFQALTSALTTLVHQVGLLSTQVQLNSMAFQGKSQPFVSSLPQQHPDLPEATDQENARASPRGSLEPDYGSGSWIDG